jgi:hypothetical protein
MHELLFARQKALEDADLLTYAAEFGLDVAAFDRDRASRAVADRIRRDVDSGLASGQVAGTPTLFTDGVVYRGGYDPPALLAPRWPHELPCRLPGLCAARSWRCAPRGWRCASRGGSQGPRQSQKSRMSHIYQRVICHEGNSLHIHEPVTRPCVVSSGCGCSSDPSYLLASRRRHGQGPRFPGSRRSVVTEGRSGPHRCDVGAVPRCCPAPGRACYAWFVPSACRPPPGSA